MSDFIQVAAVSRVPPEILDQIFGQVAQDRPSLASCMLVCRRWLPHTYRHRFATFVFRENDVQRSPGQLLGFLRGASHICAHVEVLRLDTGPKGSESDLPQRNSAINFATLKGLIAVLPALRTLNICYDLIYANGHPPSTLNSVPSRPLDRLMLRGVSMTEDVLKCLFTELFSSITHLDIRHVNVPLTSPAPWPVRLRPRYLRLMLLPPRSLPLSCLGAIFDLAEIQHLQFMTHWAASEAGPSLVGHYNSILRTAGRQLRDFQWWSHGVGPDTTMTLDIPAGDRPLRLSVVVSSPMTVTLHLARATLHPSTTPAQWRSALLTLAGAPPNVASVQLQHRVFPTAAGVSRDVDVDLADLLDWHLASFEWPLFADVIDGHPELRRVALLVNVTPGMVGARSTPGRGVQEAIGKFTRNLRELILAGVSVESKARAEKALVVEVSNLRLRPPLET